MSDHRRDIVDKLKADAQAQDEEDELHQELKRFRLAVLDCKRHFGQWDMYDPAVWAILRLVSAQNDFAKAMELVGAYGVDGHVVEQAIAERLRAVAALQRAIKEEPRGFQ